MEKIKQDRNKWKIFCVHWLEDSIFLIFKLFLTWSIDLIQSESKAQKASFVDTNLPLLKAIWKGQRAHKTQQNVDRKKEERRRR